MLDRLFPFCHIRLSSYFRARLGTHRARGCFPLASAKSFSSLLRLLVSKYYGVNIKLIIKNSRFLLLFFSTSPQPPPSSLVLKACFLIESHPIRHPSPAKPRHSPLRHAPQSIILPPTATTPLRLSSILRMCLVLQDNAGVLHQASGHERSPAPSRVVRLQEGHGVDLFCHVILCIAKAVQNEFETCIGF